MIVRGANKLGFAIQAAILISLYGFCSLGASAQAQTPQDILKSDFPSLWKTFGKQTVALKADYVVAVDVSGSMKKFQDVVVPNVTSFIESLPDGDYVSIIAIGTDARIVGVPSEITSTTKNSIKAALASMPFKEQNTDLALMSETIINELNRPGGSDLKFVFAFTDFDHDPAAQRKGREDWSALSTRFAAEQSGKRVEFYAMKLQLTEKSGRDLARIKSIFPELQEIPVQPSTLEGWFQRRKAEILRERLKFIVSRSASGQPPAIEGFCEGSQMKAKIGNPGKNELISGLTIQMVQFEKTPSSPEVTPGRFPVDMESSGGPATVLGAIEAGPVFLEPVPPPRVSLTTKWILRCDSAEISRLGCRLPESPSSLTVEGKLSPPGRMEFRAHGLVVEGRLMDAAPGISANLHAVAFPDLDGTLMPAPVPIALLPGVWTKIASASSKGLISRSLSVGTVKVTANFVTKDQQKAPVADLTIPVPGSISLGLIPFWEAAVAVATFILILLYLLFCYRPGKKFMGKIVCTPPGKEQRLQPLSGLRLCKGAKGNESLCEGLPESLDLRFYVAGSIFSPIRGSKTVSVAKGVAEVGYKVGRAVKASRLRAGQSHALPQDLPEFTVKSGGWSARWTSH